MTDHYILDGHKAVRVDDLMTWATKFEDAEFRRVSSTKVNGIEVSTVFLGLDHSFGHGPPAIFESMIFGGEHDQGQWRYSTWEEAESGHKRIVAALEAGEKP